MISRLLSDHCISYLYFFPYSNFTFAGVITTDIWYLRLSIMLLLLVLSYVHLVMYIELCTFCSWLYFVLCSLVPF